MYGYFYYSLVNNRNYYYYMDIKILRSIGIFHDGYEDDSDWEDHSEGISYTYEEFIAECKRLELQ